MTHIANYKHYLDRILVKYVPRSLSKEFFTQYLDNRIVQTDFKQLKISLINNLSDQHFLVFTLKVGTLHVNLLEAHIHTFYLVILLETKIDLKLRLAIYKRFRSGRNVVFHFFKYGFIALLMCCLDFNGLNINILV